MIDGGERDLPTGIMSPRHGRTTLVIISRTYPQIWDSMIFASNKSWMSRLSLHCGMAFMAIVTSIIGSQASGCWIYRWRESLEKTGPTTAFVWHGPTKIGRARGM